MSRMARLLAAHTASFRRLKAHPFARKAGALMGGAGLGQLVAILVLPVVTRIYTPADIQLLALFASFVGIIVPVACLRFDIALAVPHKSSDAFHLLGLALLCCILVASLATTLAAALCAWGPARLSEHMPLAWLVFPAVLLGGATSALTYWYAREGRVGRIAAARIGQSIAGGGVQVGAGLAGLGPAGLLGGYVVSTGGLALASPVRRLRAGVGALSALRWAELRRLAREYRRYPIFGVPESILNNGAIQLPMIILAVGLHGAEAAYVFLAYRVMQAPLGLFGVALAQTYLGEAVEARRRGALTNLTTNILRALLLSGVGPLAFAGIVAPHAFPVLFGAEWTYSGEIVSWMTPWLILQFLTSPLTNIFQVAEEQRLALLVQAGGALLRTLPLAAAVQLIPATAVPILILGATLFYGIYLIVLLRVARISVAAFARLVWRSLPVTLGWMAAGASVAVASTFFLG